MIYYKMDSSCEEKTKEVTSVAKNLPTQQKLCLVCGDKALGYNFNAISCESCKAFFRRNALTSKEFKCPFSNNCEIKIITRRFCQKCRLDKCFSIGMVKEFIMSDEDKAEKRKKIEENRAKKRSLKDGDNLVSSSKMAKLDNEAQTSYSSQEPEVIQYDMLNSTTCSPNSTVQSPLSTEMDNSHQSSSVYSTYVPAHNSDTTYSMKMYGMDEKTQYDPRLIESYNVCDSMLSLDSNMYGEQSKQNTIRSILINDTTSSNTIFQEPPPHKAHTCEELPSTSSADEDANKAREILEDVQRIEHNSMESILCEAIKLEFQSYNPCSGSSRELNEVEQAKLNELIVANKAHHAPIDEDLSQLTKLIGDTTCNTGLRNEGKHDPRLVKIVNITALAIRRFIKMSKKINAFKNMCEEDQVALLKGGCIEMMVLRSTMNYDGQRNQWKLPLSQEFEFGNIRTDVLKLAKGNIYRSYEAFIRSFEPRWRTDEHVILIMCAIVLFSPKRPKLVHINVVTLEQSSYYYLLRRYLESVYPGCEAKSTFLKLMEKIQELHKLAEEVTGVYLDVNPIEPLLMEIFDLKHAT